MAKEKKDFIDFDSALNESNVGNKKPSKEKNKNIDEFDTIEIDKLEERDRKLKEAAAKSLLISDDSAETKKINLFELFNKKEKEEEKPKKLTFEESKPLIAKDAIRYNPSLEEGLNDEQIDERIASGYINHNKKTYSKTYREIFFNNIFTFFNILCFAVAIALILVKSWGDLFFMIVFLSNMVIGIIQEIKAKKTIDKLTIVTAPTANVKRNKITKEIPVTEIVLDDIIMLRTGKQISADCVVKEGSIEVNEALLTGEAIPIKKSVGDELYAGSFVSSGSCMAQVDKIGQDCYIEKLQAKAKKYSKPKSELLRSLQIVISVIGIIIIPLGIFSAYRNFSSAQITALDSQYKYNDEYGKFEVYGLTTDDSEILIASLNEQISSADYEYAYANTASNVTLNENAALLGRIVRIKIIYTDKLAGNIGISEVRLSLNNSENQFIFQKEFTPDTPQGDWIYSNGVVGYEDGSIKLDESGMYIISDNFTGISENFTVSIKLKSNGYIRGSSDYNTYVRYQTVTKTAGSLIGMIPAGMFLLTSMALAVGVVRLAKKKTTVQELYCIEMLARVDMLCLDKTGTITDGTMKVKEIIEIGKVDKLGIPFDALMGSILSAVDDNNQTSIALKNRFGENFELKAKTVLPFSSSRKLSAVTFEDNKTYIMGAPEYVYTGKSKKINTLVAKKSAMGYRVIMVAQSDIPLVKGKEKAPANNTPLALIVLEDHIRDEAIDTIKWFNDNGVQIKVISGDNPATVAEIASRVGIIGAGDYVSLEGLSDKDVETIASEYTVFGRVTPEQKAILIKSLKKKGNTVAMTGDGVNDILAMKEADCSVAMASGAEAARNVSHLVLMDSNFASMPKVVEEGRRVINNIQRSSSLFLMKTLFTMLLTIITIIFADIFINGYPFSTKQLMLLESFVIGVPSFVLALQPNNQKVKGNFLKNVFSNCFPSALFLLLSVCIIYFLVPDGNFDLKDANEVSSMCVIVITFIGMVILYNVCRPLTTYRTTLIIFMLLIILAAITFTPKYFGIIGDISLQNKLLCAVIILASIPLIRFITDLLKKIEVENIEKP